MSEPPVKLVLQKPPGYKDPKAPADQRALRPPPRKPVLPPSFHLKKRKTNYFRTCCCCFCIFFFIFLLVIISGAVFYLWFNLKLPRFHVQSFRISHFNVTKRPDGTYLDDKTTTRLEVRNANGKMSYYYGDTKVDVTVGERGDKTELGTTTVPEFTMWKKNMTSLRAETKVSNKLVVDEVGNKLKNGYRSKSLTVNVEARTRVGVSVAWLKTGRVGLTVKCNGISEKQLDGGDMPKCAIMLKW
ncbi:NDR1/HIN1-like protein 13 [Hibiscus syriacus]|uniref:NDR1/HIN1-like protein 13 n=1 Tax=Hibiscus syriacus TaxID=106335 RepID=UPI001923A915|nr:NDR1/HIN1-like protein 13 [Hibiscus syriacus]